MCISGLTSLQRSLWESAKAGRIGKVPWMLIGSGNKLIDLHNLYCGGDELDKSLVKIFIDGTLDDVRANFQVWQGFRKGRSEIHAIPHCYRTLLFIYLSTVTYWKILYACIAVNSAVWDFVLKNPVWSILEHPKRQNGIWFKNIVIKMLKTYQHMFPCKSPFS